MANGILKNPFTASNNHILRLKSDFSGFSRFKVNHIRCFFSIRFESDVYARPPKGQLPKNGYDFKFQILDSKCQKISFILSLLGNPYWLYPSSGLRKCLTLREFLSKGEIFFAQITSGFQTDYNQSKKQRPMSDWHLYLHC